MGGWYTHWLSGKAQTPWYIDARVEGRRSTTECEGNCLQRIFAVILAGLVASGCASITRGTTEVFVIETTPPGARASLSNGLTCTTPCSLEVPRRGDFVVTIERDGYETVRSTVVSGVDGEGAAGMGGNVIFGGFIGAGIDAGSGAMHSHKPNPLQVALAPLGTAPANEEPADEGFQDTADEIDDESPE